MRTVVLIISAFLMSPFCRADDVILERINQQRQTLGEVTLCRDIRLDNSARVKACALRDKNFWSHTYPSGRGFWEDIEDAGYYYTRSGEILAKGCENEGCMRLWLDSPTHRQVILDGEYRQFGIGRCGKFTAVHFGVI